MLDGSRILWLIFTGRSQQTNISLAVWVKNVAFSKKDIYYEWEMETIRGVKTYQCRTKLALCVCTYVVKITIRYRSVGPMGKKLRLP